MKLLKQRRTVSVMGWIGLSKNEDREGMERQNNGSVRVQSLVNGFVSDEWLPALSSGFVRESEFSRASYFLSAKYYMCMESIIASSYKFSRLMRR